MRVRRMVGTGHNANVFCGWHGTTEPAASAEEPNKTRHARPQPFPPNQETTANRLRFLIEGTHRRSNKSCISSSISDSFC